MKAKSIDHKLTVEIRVYCDPLLKSISGKAADEAGIPLSEFVAQALAEKVKRVDLGKVPRKSLGRPRKEIILNGRS